MLRLTPKQFCLVNFDSLIMNIVTDRSPGDYTYTNKKNKIRKKARQTTKFVFWRAFSQILFLIVYAQRVAGRPSGHDIRDQRSKINSVKMFWSRTEHS